MNLDIHIYGVHSRDDMIAGDVYVGSTSGINKDDGSKKLATEAYVDERACVLTSSTPNSTKKFKITVDDAGTLSAVEATIP